MKSYKQIKPEKQIRIPLQLTQKLDKISLIDLRTTELRYKNQTLMSRGHNTVRNHEFVDKNQFGSNRNPRKQGTISMQSKFSDPKILTQQNTLPRERSLTVRFRTTGAGFRQRSNNKPKQRQSETKQRQSETKQRQSETKQRQSETKMQVRRVQIKLKMQAQKKIELLQRKQQQLFKDCIVQKAEYSKREQKTIEKRRPAKRIHFGQNAHFREEPQFVYSDKSIFEDQAWDYLDEEYKFSEKGFGVNSNLSNYDLASLEDPNAQQFLSRFQQKTGYCPMRIGQHYKWVAMKVMGFDPAANKVIVKRQQLGDIKKVSRLSIRFDIDYPFQQSYWQRIKQAKIQSNGVRELQKFRRYLNSRKEQFPQITIQFSEYCTPKWKQTIHNEWYAYYSRMFMVYKQMELKPDKFTSMGIKIRTYKPFHQLPIVQPFYSYEQNSYSYEQNREMLMATHYSRFSKFPQTLYKLFDRLNKQSCIAFEYGLRSEDADMVLECELKKLRETTSILVTKIRELLVSDILGGLAFSFKNKKQSLKYYKLHNFIYEGLILERFYERNTCSWLEYLQSFTKFTSNTPQPLLKLSVSLQSEKKQMYTIPSIDKITDVLTKPLSVLQIQTQKIPDLLCEAIGGALHFIKIKSSLLQQSKQRIVRLVEHCFAPIAAFMLQLQPKLQYLSGIALTKEQFSQAGRKKYMACLQQIADDLNYVTHSLVFHSGFFEVDSSPIKTSLEAVIVKQKNKMGKMVQKQIEEEIAEMLKQFQQKQEQMKNIPIDEWELVAMREWLNGACQQFLDYAINHYQLCNQYFSLLEQFYITYKPNIFDKNMQMVIVQLKLVQAINAKLSQLNQLEQSMIEKINDQRQAILRGVEEVGDKIEAIKGFSSWKKYSEHYVYVNRNYMLLEQYQDQLGKINKRETVLKQSISIFPILDKLIRELRPYNQLWNMVYELNTIITNMQSDHIKTLNYDTIRDKFQAMQRDSQNLVSLFTSLKNVTAFGIAQLLLEKIAKLQEKLWIIRSFTLEGMIKKEGIRNEVLNKVFDGKEVKFSELTLQMIQAENVGQYKDFVVSNSEKAERIWRLELKITDIVNQVKKLQLVVATRDSTSMVEEKELLSLSCAVHEQLSIIEAIKDLQEAKYIQKKVASIHQKFKIIEETLLLMINFQQTFFPLKGLLKIDEIQSEMGKEAATFAEVQKLWKTTCNHFAKDGQLWQAIDTDSHKNRIENGLKLMQEVQRTLNTVIDKRRSEFARLYFIDRQEVKWLLLNSDKINRSDFMKVMFAGIQSIIFEPEEVIRGVNGYDGEQIVFKKQTGRKIIWQDLKVVQDELSKIVQWEINITANKNQKYGFGHAVRLLCQYTYTIEDAIANKTLKNVHTKIMEQLRQLSKQRSIKNVSLASILLHFRDKVQTLINKNVGELASFEWRKEIKYYRTEGGSVEMRTINLSLPFNSEYASTLMRPIVLLSDRVALQTIVSAWHMNSGLVLKGKTVETVRQLCGITLRHFSQLSLTKDTSQDRLQCLLKGYLCSDVWVCFEIQSAVTRQIFEMLSQVSYQIHSTIESGRTLFFIGRDHFNLSKAFRFNMFIKVKQSNSQHGVHLDQIQQSGHQRKALKFGVVYRQVSWIVPPQILIIQFILHSLALTRDTVGSILRCYEVSILNNAEQWYNRDFSCFLHQFMQKYLKSAADSDEDGMKIFGEILQSKFKPTHMQQFYHILSRKQSTSIEQQFDQLVELVESKSITKHILVVGAPLSGKRTFITAQLSAKNMEFIEPLQYSTAFLHKWVLIEQTFYEQTVPAEQKMVVRAKQTARLHPGAVGSFMVLYYRESVSWQKVFQAKINTTSVSAQFRAELLKQLTIYFTTYFNQGQDQVSRKIAFILSAINFIAIQNKTGKYNALNIMQRVEVVFMLIVWQSAAIFPQIKLSPAHFGSTLHKDPLLYYFDIQKSTWLEWVTLSEFHTDNNKVEYVSELFVPVRESISLVYFLSSTAYQSNIWIQSESRGIGVHRMIERIISKGILQMFRVHKQTTYQGLSRVINYDVAIFKKQGKFYPKLGQHLTICIQDINMSNSLNFMNQTSNLVNYSYDRSLKRLITNTSFICTHQDGYSTQEDMVLHLAKNMVHLRAFDFGEESKKTIFGYYLEWFFGNTQNPFSKDVRATADLLIQLSIFITNSINQHNKMVDFAHLMRLFEGICIASPRTVKSTSDILQLWLHEANAVFWDGRFRVSNERGFINKLIKEYCRQHGMEYERVVIDQLLKCMEMRDLVFIKKQSMKVEYSQTYRKVELNTVYETFQQQIIRLNYKIFSNLPLILYKDLFFFVLKLIRILSIPKRHLLLYGGRQSCQRIIVRLASFMKWGIDASCIECVQGWQKDLISAIKQLVKDGKGQALAFKTSADQNESFMSVVQQMIFLNHPRSFLLDKQLKYLQQMGLSSANSEQYLSFKTNMERNLHCCITSPQISLQKLIQSYPALLRRVQSINVLQNYLRNGLQEICQSSVGTYFDQYTEMLEINSILIGEGIEGSKQQWIKISQLMIYYYQQSAKKVQTQKQMIRKGVMKIRMIEQQKIQLQNQLKDLNLRLQKIKTKVQQLWQEYKIDDDQYQKMVANYNDYNEQCDQQRSKTNKMREEVDFELGKVMPLLTSAEQAMAKVTRDDINQLRSFPNPPLPAAKVVESLIFLFNQSQLVKEKVLEGGQKVRDFWEYAKKFILNDRLLKRVSEYKAEKIKSLDKTIIQTLKGIIKRPEFIQQRVFKASSAAGNLSLWIKAIVAVYDVMTVIQPKKQKLMAAQQILSQKQAHLKKLLDELNDFHAGLLQKKKNYDLKVDERERVISKIKKIEQYLSGGEQLLEMLHAKQKQWQKTVNVDLVNVMRSVQRQTMIISIFIEVLVPLELGKKAKIVKKLSAKYHAILKQALYKNIFMEVYQQKYYRWFQKCRQQPEANSNYQCLALTQNYSEGLIALHELLKMQKKVILVYDTSQLVQLYLRDAATTECFDLQVEQADCLQFKTLQKKVKAEFEEQQSQQSSKNEQKNRRITLITNLEHRPELFGSFDDLLEEFSDAQIIVLVKENTEQWIGMMKMRSLNFSITIERTQDLIEYFIKKTFNLSVVEMQELNHFNQHKHLKDKFFQILINQQQLITHQQALEEIILTNSQQTKMRTEVAKHKKLSKIEQEKLKQITEIYQKYNHIGLPLFIEIMKQFLRSEENQTQNTFWTFPDYLRDKLEKINDSVVQIVKPQTPEINSLAFYLLCYQDIQQLQKKQQIQSPSNSHKQGLQKQLLSLKWQIVNPMSVLSVLRRNEHAFVCLTSKYKLQRALDQCKLIEQKFRNEYIDEIVEREQFAGIYLFSQCGHFDVKERVVLGRQRLKEVITYEQGVEISDLGESYGMQRFHRKFNQMLNKQRQYAKTTLYNKPAIKHNDESQIIRKIRQKQKSLMNQNEASLKIEFLSNGEGDFEFAGRKVILLRSKGLEQQMWEIIQSIYSRSMQI